MQRQEQSAPLLMGLPQHLAEVWAARHWEQGAPYC